MSKSLYKTLEINESATESEIKKAYRKLARMYHPDVNSDEGAEDKFKEINSAYEILSDSEKKRQYDQVGDGMFGGQNFSDFSRSHGSRGSADLDDILRSMFSQGGGFGGSQGGFGGGFGGGFEQEPDLDIKTNVTIPFSISILGGSHSVAVNGDRFDIKIPAGVKSGEKMRVREKGHTQNGSVGDLYLTITVASNPDYIREENNLIKTFDISLYSALFGGKIVIETLEKEIKLKVPQNTKNAQRFRVKEMGAMNRKTKVRGDLYLVANIVLPKVDELDDSLVEILQEKLPKE